MKVSIVIPVFYNEDNLRPLYADIKDKFISKIDYEYEIVGSNEADPLHGKLSDESPVGMALLDKEPDDIVHVETPSGKTVKYKVVDVYKAEEE